MDRCKFKAEAIKRGMKKYYTGKLCKNGHNAERYIHGHCVQCVRNGNKRNYPKKIKTKKYKERRRKLMKIWRRKKKEKIKDRARSLLRTAVKRGVITKKPCKVCGSKKVHGHHDDYAKPLKVIWLCSQHHQEHHQKMRIK